MHLIDAPLHSDQRHIHISAKSNGQSFHGVEAERGVKWLTGQCCHQLKLTKTRRECGALALGV